MVLSPTRSLAYCPCLRCARVVRCRSNDQCAGPIRGVKDVTSPDGMTVYAAFVATGALVVATGSLGWQLWKWWSAKSETRRERSKVEAYFGTWIIKKDVPEFGDLYIIDLWITNLGREPVIITSVEMRYSNRVFSPGAFNEPEAMLGIKTDPVLPNRLDFGDTLQLEQFTLLAFQDRPEAVVVLDSEGHEYKVPDNLVQQQFDRAKRIREAAAEA